MLWDYFLQQRRGVFRKMDGKRHRKVLQVHFPGGQPQTLGDSRKSWLGVKIQMHSTLDFIWKKLLKIMLPSSRCGTITPCCFVGHVKCEYSRFSGTKCETPYRGLLIVWELCNLDLPIKYPWRFSTQWLSKHKTWLTSAGVCGIFFSVLCASLLPFLFRESYTEAMAIISYCFQTESGDLIQIFTIPSLFTEKKLSPFNTSYH